MEFDVAQWRLILVSDPGDPSDHLCHYLYHDFGIYGVLLIPILNRRFLHLRRPTLGLI